MAKKRTTKAARAKTTKAPKAKTPRKRKEPRTVKAPKPIRVPPEKRTKADVLRGGLRIKSIARLPGSRAAVTARRGARGIGRVAQGLRAALRGRKAAAAKPAKGGPRGTPRVKAARKEVKVKDK